MSIFGLLYTLLLWLLSVILRMWIVYLWAGYCIFNILLYFYYRKADKPHLVAYGLISYQIFYIGLMFQRGAIFDQEIKADGIKGAIFFLLAIILSMANLAALTKLQITFPKKLVFSNVFLIYLGSIYRMFGFNRNIITYW